MLVKKNPICVWFRLTLPLRAQIVIRLELEVWLSSESLKKKTLLNMKSAIGESK